DGNRVAEARPERADVRLRLGIARGQPLRHPDAEADHLRVAERVVTLGHAEDALDRRLLPGAEEGLLVGLARLALERPPQARGLADSAVQVAGADHAVPPGGAERQRVRVVG